MKQRDLFSQHDSLFESKIFTLQTVQLAMMIKLNKGRKVSETSIHRNYSMQTRQVTRITKYDVFCLQIQFYHKETCIYLLISMDSL